jgi:nucleoid DNA-binding protein
MELINVLILAVIVLGTIIVLTWKIYQNGLRKTAIDLIVEVEERLDDNRDKFETVVNAVIAKLPIPFNFIITTKTIEKFVQATFDEIKKALDYQKKEV